MIAEAVLRAVLGLLAVYHLAMGLAATFAPRLAARLGRALYALQAEDTPQLRYGLRMLGLYALAIGSLAALAALDPRTHVAIILVIAALQLARATARLVLRRELAAAFGIGSRRSALNAAVLVAQALALTATLPFL